MRVLKDELITEIAEESGLTKWRTKIFLKVFARVLIKHMLNGDEVNINKLGTFYVKTMPEEMMISRFLYCSSTY